MIFSKIECPCRCWRHWHLISVIVDYADMNWNRHWLCRHAVALVMTTRTRCWHRHWPRGYGVGVVIEHANIDMTMTTRTLLENFEGFSQILKVKSGKKSIYIYFRLMATSTFYSRFTNTAWLLKKVLGCVYIPNSNNLKIWNWEVTND